MLKPDKFTELNKSLIYTVALMIDSFKKNDGKCNYEQLYKMIEDTIGDDILYLFIPALDFLFLLGKVTYDINTDDLEMRI